MKTVTLTFCTIIALSFLSCSGNNKGKSKENLDLDEASTEEVTPRLTIRLQEVVNNPMPGLHSFAGARYGNQMIALTGRIEGFHGFIEADTVFKSTKANDRVWAIDFDNLAYNSTSLNPNSPYYLQLSSSNTEYCQDGDTLYVVGGFGRQSINDIQSNTTFGRLIAFHIPTLISAINNNTDPDVAILFTAESDFLKVTGGELYKEAGYYYLIGGQRFDQKYQLGYTGEYTNAVRSFKIENGAITDTSSNIQSFLHRRDFNVEKVYSSDKALYAGYGGVFTLNDNGFENPIYIYPQGTSTPTFVNEEISQISNQYNAAVLSVMDLSNNTNTHFIMGGIGKWQYDTQNSKWVEGDNGAVLPYVKTIARMTWTGNELGITYQLPPLEPELPALLGTNAVFFPLSKYLYKDNTINLSLLASGDNMVGYFFGGIKSQLPTSNSLYPTSANNQVYEVYLNVSNN